MSLHLGMSEPKNIFIIGHTWTCMTPVSWCVIRVFDMECLCFIGWSGSSKCILTVQGLVAGY